MGSIPDLTHPPHIWQTPKKHHPKIIRDVFHHSTVVNRSPYLTNPTHIWQIPPRYDKPHPYMTNPPTYDKSHPDVTNQIGRSLSLGFVEYGPLFTTVLWWNTSRIIIIWDLSPRFVIYGEYPRFDKSHPYMINPSTPRWVLKITRSALDQWEAWKLTLWPLFGQSQGSISSF